MEPVQQQPGPAFEVTPLLPSDPVRIGDFWLEGRLTANAAGIAFRAKADGKAHLTRGQKLAEGAPAIVVQLLDGSANDKAARDRFSGYVNHLHIDDVLARGGHEQDEGRLGRKFLSEDDDPVDPDSEPLAPWVALAFDGDPRQAQRAYELLETVALTNVPPTGRPAGPDYELPWVRRVWPGLNRVWPLPWPGRYDRAGWLSILVSWLLMVLIAATAVLIAIYVFKDASKQLPPSPVPSNARSGGSGRPATGKPYTGPPVSGKPHSGPPVTGTPWTGPTPTPPPPVTPSGTTTIWTPTPSGTPMEPTPSGTPILVPSEVPTEVPTEGQVDGDGEAEPPDSSAPPGNGRPTPPSRL